MIFKKKAIKHTEIPFSLYWKEWEQCWDFGNNETWLFLTSLHFKVELKTSFHEKMILMYFWKYWGIGSLGTNLSLALEIVLLVYFYLSNFRYKHRVHVIIGYQLFLEFWSVHTWVFAHRRLQRAVTRLENVFQLIKRWEKKLDINLLHKQPLKHNWWSVIKIAMKSILSSGN